MEHTNNGRNFMDRIQVWFDTVISSVRRCHSFKSIEKLIGPTVEKIASKNDSRLAYFARESEYI